MRAWLRRNLVGSIPGIVVICIAIAVGWVIWIEMDRWYSTTHVENMVGQVWEVKSADSTFEIEVLFTETSQIFTYEGSLPGYVAERQYVRALFQFGPDNGRILEFLGPANAPGLDFPKPYLWMFAFMGTVGIVAIIINILFWRHPK